MKRSLYLIAILIALVSRQGLCQSYTPLSSVINNYTKIEAIFCIDNNDTDTVRVSDTNGFYIGDTVMIYCVQGAEIVTNDDFGEENIGRDAQQPHNAGKYAFMLIDTIDRSLKFIALNTTLSPEIKPMVPGEVAQLIKVKSYRNAEVQPGGVYAKPWDPITGTGGVVTMFVSGTLKLSGDIHAEHAGFKGAPGNSDDLYGGDCSVSDTLLYGDYFYHFNDVLAGLKGEGTTNVLFDSIRGRAMNINGGGGGNGLFSGGGGGSNYSAGGRGGNESDNCSPGITPSGGNGGFQMSADYYENGRSNEITRNRVFFGGGGGSGTNVPPKVTTDGGNGGGIVIIVADTIMGMGNNGHGIYADGESVTDIATGAAGGGGGGGCIILDVNGYNTNLNLSAIGGDGGNTSDAFVTGPGGGGGGGVYWLSGDSHPEVNHNPDKGNPGQHLSDPPVTYGAVDGGNAFKVNDLETPIWGFIFNPVPTEYWVCSDQVPEDIIASEPKGGGGPDAYEYLWVDSSATDSLWSPAPGINYKKDYEFLDVDGTSELKLNDTTYFRRVVIDNRGILPNDTSFRIAVYVHQAIENNTISAPDTVCFGDSANQFFPSALIGGGLNPRDFEYQWMRNEGSGYVPAAGDSTDSTYQSPGLITSTSFTRIATSGKCVDTSDPVFVQVWDKLDDYQISDNDTVCYNERLPNELGSLTELPPINGDTLDIRYQWITSTDTINWTDIPGATSETYQPPVQTQTNYYSRIVLSGSDNACVETSDPVEILNIDPIENNTIADTRTVCTGDEGGLMIGSDPSGGLDDIQFSYLWESKTNSTPWTPVTEDTSFVKIDYDPEIMDGDTTWYRRFVGSGGVARNVCFSYSNVDTIHVLPPITNNLIITSDDLKCEDDSLEWLTQNSNDGSTPVGGDGSWTYQWQVVSGSEISDSWDDIEGATGIDYTDQPILDGDLDRWYRRHVYSGPENQCQDFSDTIHVTVHTGITNNTIDPADTACFYSFKEVLGALPAGELDLDPAYSWKDAVSGADLPGLQGQNYSDTFRLQQLYQFEREVKIGACTDTSNVMLITVMELPGGMLSADFSQSCETDVMMDIALSTGGLDNYILPWNVTLKNDVNDSIDGPYSMNESGEVEVTLNTDADSTQFYYSIAEISYTPESNSYTCFAPESQLSGEVPILVFRTPEPHITIDGAARETSKVCGNTIELEANTDGGNGVWNFDPETYINASQTSDNAYAISIPEVSEAYGTYRATFNSLLGVCSGSDSIDLYYFEQPEEPVIEGLKEDTTIFLSNVVELRVSEPNAGYGEWTVFPSDPDIRDKDSTHTIAENMKMNTAYTYTWTVRNGEGEGTCIATTDFKVVTRTEILTYQGFSPNGDMENEYFIMRGLEYADDYTVTFFNSLGNTVRTVTKENNNQEDYDPNLIMNLREDELVVWDGRSENGTLVPNGTYYFIVEYHKDETIYEPVKDYVVVLKD